MYAAETLAFTAICERSGGTGCPLNAPTMKQTKYVDEESRFGPVMSSLSGVRAVMTILFVELPASANDDIRSRIDEAVLYEQPADERGCSAWRGLSTTRKEVTAHRAYGTTRAMIVSTVNFWRARLWMLLCLLLTSSASFSACRAPQEGCSSNMECDEGAVCSSTGECQAPEARYEARREAFRRFGGDGEAYGLWLRYGTAGADQAHGIGLNEGQSGEETDAPSHAQCSIQDVRTDDLLFNHTSAYPDGYWGATPISDGKSGRCGDDLETLTWRLLNCERISRKLVPVECDLRLVWIGRQHATDMVSRDFFGHVNPDGLDAFRRLTGRGILYGLAGENLARQQSIIDAHTAWMGSPLHRRNILTEHYNYAGVGVIRSGRQLFLSEAFLGGVDEDGPLDSVPPLQLPTSDDDAVGDGPALQ